MLERTILREHFRGLLADARTAAGKYDELARSTEHAETRDQLERLAREQSRHIELTERLLEIVDE